MAQSWPSPVERIERLTRPAEGGWISKCFSDVPAHWGVFALEDAENRTLNLVTTANLQRALRTRLCLSDETQSRADTRNAVEREATGFVSVASAGSEFEADLIYLSLARERTPESYRMALDRWQAWFVHCDAAAPFPRWVKYKLGSSVQPPVAGELFGPLPEKHAAGRFMQMLEDAFDLCRYHHILEQAPHGTACAYKEMGRCPAPCDGSISMDVYRTQIEESMRFAANPSVWRNALQNSISEETSDSARRIAAQRVLNVTAEVERPLWSWLENLRNMRLLAVHKAPAENHARLFLMHGGWVERFADVPITSAAKDLIDTCAQAGMRLNDLPDSREPQLLENICVVTHHLFAPKASRSGSFLRITSDPTVGAKSLATALKRLAKKPPATDSAPNSPDQSLKTLNE